MKLATHVGKKRITVRPKIPLKRVRDLLNELFIFIEMRPKCANHLQAFSVMHEENERAEKLGLTILTRMLGLLRAGKLSPCPLCGGTFKEARGSRRNR